MLTDVLIITQITVTDSMVPLEASTKCYSDGDPRIETFDKWYSRWFCSEFLVETSIQAIYFAFKLVNCMLLGNKFM